MHSADRYERSRDAICEGRQAEQAHEGGEEGEEAEQGGAAPMQVVSAVQRKF